MTPTFVRCAFVVLSFICGIFFQAIRCSDFGNERQAGLASTEAIDLLTKAARCVVSPGAGVNTVSALERNFLSDNDKTMSSMMMNMTIGPSGDIDRDFVLMMVPHHLGAIDMAQAELKYGGNEQLRRIAQEIVVDQQQEIVAMHLAVGISRTDLGFRSR